MACTLTGADCKNPLDSKKSIVNSVTGLVAMPYAQPPASGVSYALYKLDNNDFLPSTYAYEGIGLSSIRGYVKVWEVFRNFAYLLLVMLVIAIGFMIMFRTQLDGQTVVSIQNALPRIVITLILITLSFPIAGFMIDIMYASIGVFVFLLSSAFGAYKTPPTINEQITLVNTYLGAGMWELWPHEAGTSVMSTGFAMYNVLPGLLQKGLSAIVGAGIQTILVKVWFSKIGGLFHSLNNVNAQGFTFGGSWGNLPEGATWIVEAIAFAFLSYFSSAAQWVMAGLILFTLFLFVFRIFFLLLSSYIKLVLLILFSPIIILFHVLPGKNAFGWWIKMIFGELLTFVAVIVIMITGSIIVGVNQTADIPLKLPFLNGFSAKDFGSIIGLGIVLMIPDLIKMFKGLLGIPDLGISFSPGMFFAGVTDVFSGAQQGLQSYSSIAHIPALQKILPSHLTQRITPPTMSKMLEDALQQTNIWTGKKAGDAH
jgi:hypothetical protein